jgi:hypothetical protein
MYIPCCLDWEFFSFHANNGRIFPFFVLENYNGVLENASFVLEICCLIIILSNVVIENLYYHIG